MAQTSSIVPGAFKEAATAKVTVKNLRRNVSILLGAGGNMAVLTGPDGKLVVDSERRCERIRVNGSRRDLLSGIRSKRIAC
jgi:hypothetical protein